MSSKIYKKFPPTPQGLLEHLMNATQIINAEGIREAIRLATHRYFIKCETCDGTGIVEYFSSDDPFDQEIERIGGRQSVECCPDCEGEGFNFVWERSELCWEVKDDE